MRAVHCSCSEQCKLFAGSWALCAIISVWKPQTRRSRATTSTNVYGRYSYVSVKRKKERNANYTFVQHIAALMSLLTTKRWVQSVEKANRKIRQTVPQVWTGPRHRFNQVDCRVVRRTFCWCVNRISRDVTPRVFLSPVVHRFIVVPALFESSPSVLFLLYDHFFSFYKHIINISIYTQTQTEDKTSDLKKKKMNFVDKE